MRPPAMTPEDFMSKWRDVDLSELLDLKKPTRATTGGHPRGLA